MRVIVIGGTGHIGTWLIPRLVELGHEVISVSRGGREPYQVSGAWKHVERVTLDREREEAAGKFGGRIAARSPDVVIDLIGFTLSSVEPMVQALEGRVSHYLFCGTIWVHGPSTEVPLTEEALRRPFGDYGVKKAEIETWLLDRARRHGFPATILHPGHIVGPGWIPLNPQGNFNPSVYRALARGERLPLANLGMETVHHVHADDVAQAFTASMASRSTAVGESFHVVAASAITLRGYAESVARWFGRDADLEYLGWTEFQARVGGADASATWDHIAHSPHCSIEKGRRLIGYAPRYSPLQAVREGLAWLVEHGKLEISVDEVARYNRERWEDLARAGVRYTRPFLDLDAQRAREVVDLEGRLGRIRGRSVLCLAGGGGQQSAAFTLLGARVTVLDLSPTQLERDREAAARYGLDVRTVEGDMRDLSVFRPRSFHIIDHAHSLPFVPDAVAALREVARVLRRGGIYRLSTANPGVHGVWDRWNGSGYLLPDQPYIEGARIRYDDDRWDVHRPDGTHVKIAGPREYRHTLPTIINTLAGLGLWLTAMREMGLEDPAPPASPPPRPGSWEHFCSVAPPYVTLWFRKSTPRAP